MQGNHVMFRQILHMYIGKMRIKNESSNAFKTPHVQILHMYIAKYSFTKYFSWFSFCRTYERM
jgi:hypothetical protein